MQGNATVLIRIVITVWLFTAISAMSILGEESKQKITEKQAVEIAEKFVRENGYTALQPRLKQLVSESLECGGTEAEKLLLRHNTLEAKAYEVMPYTKGWIVVFQYSKEARQKSKVQDGNESIDERSAGRAVTMDEFGHEVLMAHQDIFLKTPKKKP